MSVRVTAWSFKENTMTASELIEMLSDLPSDTEVYVWFDGERLSIDNVDPVDSGYADINVRGE
jgi:hypothetical protein